jgi:hypothetical protein
MNIEAIEQKLTAIEEVLPKLKAVINDVKVCNSDISKTILMSAVKKFSTPIVDFNLNTEE